MRLRGSRLRMALLALIAVIIGVSVATASGGARVVGNCTRSQVRPANIIVACADGNIALTRLRWSTFGGTVARASGQFSYNDCNPNCAAGHFHSVPATVVLSKPRRCPDGHRDYRLADTQFTSSRRPPSTLTAGTVTLSCPLKG